MLDELKPLTLGEAARRIGVDPFEVVRLLVLRGESAQMRVPRSRVEELREYAGVEVWWTPDAAVIEDDNPGRARVRTALQMLLDRGHVGDQLTRVDNLWRGLAVRDQEVLDGAINALAEEGVLRLVSAEQGLKVSATDKAAAKKLGEMVKTASFSDAVSGYWE